MTKHLIRMSLLGALLTFILAACTQLAEPEPGAVVAASSSGGSSVTGDPEADGWAFQGHSLDTGVFVRGGGEFAFDIYTAAFILDSGSPLLGDGWQVGDEIVAIGGVIDPDDANPNLTHSVRIVSKFSAGNDGWSAGGSGSFSSRGGDGALLLATPGPVLPEGNTEHLNPFPGYGSDRVATALFPGLIHEIPMLQRVEDVTVNEFAGTAAGKFIYLSGGPDYTDGYSGETAPLLSSWQVFANVTMLAAARTPVPEVGHRAVQALQRSTSRTFVTDGLGVIEELVLVLNPTTRQECQKGGWKAFGFKNQGQCIRFVNTGKDSR